LIDLTTLNHALADAQCIAAGRVVWRDQVTSTSDVVASLDTCHGAVCVAGLQTAGRGRRGSRWQVPPGGGILMSMGWQLTSQRAGGLSLACGVAVRNALGRCGVTGVSLKWTNDMLVAGRKLGGILIELSGRRCIVGVGLNRDIGTPHDGVQHPGQTRTPWTDLKQEGFSPDPTGLYGALIIELCNTLAAFDARGFDAFRAEWQAAHHFHGREVDVISSSGSVRGIVTGADPSGGLVLETPHGQRVFYAGEVSMLPAAARL